MTGYFSVPTYLRESIRSCEFLALQLDLSGAITQPCLCVLRGFLIC